jgi:glutamate synthase (NADPH/NADH) large chain
MVGVEDLADPEDEALVRALVEEHVARTGSLRGRCVLSAWAEVRARFKKVIPTEYKRVLEARRLAEALPATGTAPFGAPRASDSARHLKLLKRP